LTGLSVRQLGYLDRTGFFTPSFATDNRRRPFSRIYSFRDIVGLRTIAKLRSAFGISLQELRKVRPWLEQHHATPWASLRIYVGGKRIFFDDPVTGERMAGRPAGQTAFPVEMAPIVDEVNDEMQKLRLRQPETIGNLARNRHVAHNAWVVAGTRIPTRTIWEFHTAGYDTDAIIGEYPDLSAEDIQEAIRHEEALRHRAAG
jgi:uncharacterized protein (DUF433 family)